MTLHPAFSVGRLGAHAAGSDRHPPHRRRSALVGVILLQRSEGGALGGLSGGGGVSGFLTGRGQANALTRATAILGAMFFAPA